MNENEAAEQALDAARERATLARRDAAMADEALAGALSVYNRAGGELRISD